MTRKRLVAGGLILVVGAFLWQSFRLIPSDPRYREKRLSQWFRESFNSTEAHADAKDAARSLGSQALPLLRHYLRVRESGLERFWINLILKLPKKLSDRFEMPLPKEAIQERALQLLGEIGPPARPVLDDLLALLETHLASTNWSSTLVVAGQRLNPTTVRIVSNLTYQALQALEKIGCDRPELVPLLIQAIEDSNGAIQAVRLLGNANIRTAVESQIPFLIRCLDQPEHARVGALVALAPLLPDKPELIPEIVSQLESPFPNVSAQAAICLRDAHHQFERIVPVLINQLRKDPSVGTFDGGSFLRVADSPHSSGARREMSYVPIRFFWTFASRSLRILQPRSEKVIEALINALLDQEATLAERAAKTLTDLGPPANPAVPNLEKLVGHLDSPVRFAAAWALWIIDQQHEPIVAFRIDELLDQGKAVNWEAVDFLGNLGPKAAAAAPALAQRLDDEDWRIRGKIAEALGKIGASSPEVLAALEKRKTDEYSIVRNASLEALQKLQSDSKEHQAP